MSIQNRIQKINKILSEEQSMSLKGSTQEHILFPPVYLQKMRELEETLLKRYEIRGKSKVYAIAASYLLEEISNGKKDEKV